MTFDFPVAATITVSDESALREALADHEAVRLAGTGSAQSRIPAPPTNTSSPVTVVSLAGMDRILRLEADDLTCSVEAGVRRETLDRELESLGLWLPCEGSGTIGGIFAADETGPAGPAQPEPRSLLLGMTAFLAEGKRFRSGARVVKNVAGFDLQKLFVGSRGRYFAATELHLKLRPLPRSTFHFANTDLSLDDALVLTRRLRTHATRPIRLALSGDGNHGLAVRGTLAGNPEHLERVGLHLELATAQEPFSSLGDCLSPSANESTSEDLDREHGEGNTETIRGQVRFAQLRDLLKMLPTSAPFALAGERFTALLPRDATDEFLRRMPGVGAAGEITHADATRRGIATGGDPIATRLADELETALDPKGVLR